MKRYLPLLISATACLLASSAIAAPATPTPPDFTKGDQPGKEHDWTLGPTGARGWIFTANGHSRDARQILVTEVASGSPAEKELAVGDVILGVNEAPFADDARITFAKAIAAAEAKDGALKLLRWRAGKTEVVELKLAVLGSRSATSPYDCEKSKRILELGCASLAKRMSDEKSYVRRLDGISRALNGLALLASGNKDYLPLIQREAKWAADFTTDGYLSWYYGFMMTFVAEYVMATGDTSVMPGLTRLALETARGQSAVGTWGHRFSPNGYNLGGYGAMNAPGIPLTIGMVLAREAGVKHADLDKGIAKAANFLRWYVHKGAVPYGDHQPFFAHEDNGKCAASAVLFDLLGDREAAEFFAKMAAAGYSERERGHTGNFFNMLWAMQGVARCGPLTSGAYLQEQAWYYDLARSWDTRFIYQGSPVGEEEHGAYKNWDCSGSYLLDCALPLKSLRITGKKGFTVPPLDAAQTAEVIAAGRDFAYKGDANRYDQRPTPQLLAGLASWSPFVRGRSAAALGQRDGDHLPALLKMLAGKDRDARYGAIEALGALGPRADAAVPQLRACLTETDPWVQSLAAEAMPQLSPELRKACVSDLLAMTLRENAADPRRMAQRAASIALFAPFPGKRTPRSILTDSLNGVDRALLHPAIESLLQNEDPIVRGSLAKSYQKLSDEDLVRLLPAIVKAIEKPAPSNEMFADGVRLAGLDLLSRLHIREGMALIIQVIEPQRWGEKNRSKACLDYLKRYGKHTQAILPQLAEIRAQLVSANKSKQHLAEFDEQVAALSASTETPTLVELKAFKAAP
ncbi:MAG: HEAT repeat domain-containing protein [Verrucomicrobiaceae bacterium]|nr:HEAT repeat domain-containing protein [Verrucomicrobiaceae bacterium]